MKNKPTFTIDKETAQKAISNNIPQEIERIKCNIQMNPDTIDVGCYQFKRILVYHPSNSKKGFAIKGTSLRVSFEYI